MQGEVGGVFKIAWRPAIFSSISLAALYLGGRHLDSSAQTVHYTRQPNAERGDIVYKGGCIACHGTEGEVL